MTPQPIWLVFMSPKGGTPRIHSLGRHDTGPSFCIHHHHPPTNSPPPLSPYPSAPMTPQLICLVFMSPKGGTPRIHSLGRHDTGPSFCIHHHHLPTNPPPPQSLPISPHDTPTHLFGIHASWGFPPEHIAFCDPLPETHIEACQQRMNYYVHAPQTLGDIDFEWEKKSNAHFG